MRTPSGCPAALLHPPPVGTGRLPRAASCTKQRRRRKNTCTSMRSKQARLNAKLKSESPTRKLHGHEQATRGNKRRVPRQVHEGKQPDRSTREVKGQQGTPTSNKTCMTSSLSTRRARMGDHGQSHEVTTLATTVGQLRLAAWRRLLDRGRPFRLEGLPQRWPCASRARERRCPTCLLSPARTAPSLQSRTWFSLQLMPFSQHTHLSERTWQHAAHLLQKD